MKSTFVKTDNEMKFDEFPTSNIVHSTVGESVVEMALEIIFTVFEEVEEPTRHICEYVLIQNKCIYI